MEIHFNELFIPYCDLMSNFLEPLKGRPNSESLNELNNLSMFLLLGIHREYDLNGRDLNILSFDISQSIGVPINEIDNSLRKLTDLELISAVQHQPQIQGVQIIDVRPIHQFFHYEDFQEFLIRNNFTIIE